MKKLLLHLFLIIPILGFSQLVTTNPDTVCIGSSGSTYQLPANPGYTYNWSVQPPGIILTGQGTNQITVDWSLAQSGLILNAVSVSATNQSGCSSQPVNLNVFIYQLFPTINSIGPYCQSNACVDLIGTPSGGTFSGPGVSQGQFCPSSAGLGSNAITYSYSSGGCVFTVTSNVVVNPNPTLSPIEHD